LHGLQLSFKRKKVDLTKLTHTQVNAQIHHQSFLIKEKKFWPGYRLLWGGIELFHKRKLGLGNRMSNQDARVVLKPTASIVAKQSANRTNEQEKQVICI
jgi:hypothetical protein